MTDEQTPVTIGDVPAPPIDAGRAEAAEPAGGEAPASREDPGADQVTLDLDALSSRAAERDEYLALAQRTRADFENYRKRVAREAASAASRATVRVVRELLPAIDNLGRALAAASSESAGGPAGEVGTLVEGMRLVQGELIGALARVGVESYEPLGERFDPELHEAIAQHHVAGAEAGTVVEVYQSGYRLDAVVIRPARVVVAGALPPGDPQGG
jgi:molecular chaperone GrpE